MPMPSLAGQFTTTVQSVGKLPCRLAPSGPKLVDGASEALREKLGLAAMAGGENSAVRTQANSPGLCCCKCRLRSVADHLTFVFGENSEELQGQPVCLGHVGGPDIDPGFQKLGNERQRP